MRQAMKERMDESMKGRIDERLCEEDMKWWRGQWTKGWREQCRKGAETSNIDPKIYRKRVPKLTKTVPKSTQKGPKTKSRHTRNQSKVFKMILDSPGGRFSRYGGRARCHLGCQNRAEFVKKTMSKIVNFLIVVGSEKSKEQIPKPFQNWAQDGLKSRFKIEPRRKDKRKMEKV